MKSFLVGLVLVGAVVLANAATNNVRLNDWSSYRDADTVTETPLTITSTTVTTSAAIYNGARRQYQNLGSGDVYYSYASTTSITTNGFKLAAGATLTEDMYFGDIYFQSSTTSNNVRQKLIKKK